MGSAVIWLGSWSHYVPTNAIRAEWGPGPTLQLSGRMNGPGNAKFYLDEITADVKVLAQFHLGTERMPATGTVFRSAPVARFTGDVYADTSFAALFDDPSATCKLRASQFLYVGGQHVDTSYTEEMLVEIIDANPVSRMMKLPSTFEFPPLQFILDRRQHLEIDLELIFSMYLEGDGWVQFNTFLDRPPLTIRLPQWEVFSID